MAQNDQLVLTLSGFKPGLSFDMFTVENSLQDASGSANPDFNGGGLAWYQSDVKIGQDGKGKVTIQTILLNETFGFDDETKLKPHSTFHLGFWFDDPKDANQSGCIFQGFTRFNPKHRAGPNAFITRPDPLTGLGPLCTKPDTTVSPAVCKN